MMVSSLFSMDTLFQQCCDLMSFLSKSCGVTYEELNMVAFYILQPVIYCSILLWELFVLYQMSENKSYRRWLRIASVLPVLYLVIIGCTYVGADLDTLCWVKINSMYAMAERLGTTYVIFNLVVFIFLFLLVCLLHILFLCFNRTRLAQYINVFLLLASPFLVFVFFT